MSRSEKITLDEEMSAHLIARASQFGLTPEQAVRRAVEAMFGSATTTVTAKHSGNAPTAELNERPINVPSDDTAAGLTSSGKPSGKPARVTEPDKPIEKIEDRKEAAVKRAAGKATTKEIEAAKAEKLK